MPIPYDMLYVSLDNKSKMIEELSQSWNYDDHVDLRKKSDLLRCLDILEASPGTDAIAEDPDGVRCWLSDVLHDILKDHECILDCVDIGKLVERCDFPTMPDPYAPQSGTAIYLLRRDYLIDGEGSNDADS